MVSTNSPIFPPGNALQFWTASWICPPNLRRPSPDNSLWCLSPTTEVRQFSDKSHSHLTKNRTSTPPHEMLFCTLPRTHYHNSCNTHCHSQHTCIITSSPLVEANSSVASSRVYSLLGVLIFLRRNASWAAGRTCVQKGELWSQRWAHDTVALDRTSYAASSSMGIPFVWHAPSSGMGTEDDREGCRVQGESTASVNLSVVSESPVKIRTVGLLTLRGRAFVFTGCASGPLRCNSICLLMRRRFWRMEACLVGRPCDQYFPKFGNEVHVAFCSTVIRGNVLDRANNAESLRFN